MQRASLAEVPVPSTFNPLCSITEGACNQWPAASAFLGHLVPGHMIWTALWVGGSKKEAWARLKEASYPLMIRDLAESSPWKGCCGALLLDVGMKPFILSEPAVPPGRLQAHRGCAEVHALGKGVDCSKS